MDVIPDLPGGRPLKGRGAVSNATGRYERQCRVRVDDGWSAPDGADDGLQTLGGPGPLIGYGCGISIEKQ